MKKRLLASMLLATSILATGCGTKDVAEADTQYTRYEKLSDEEKKEKAEAAEYFADVKYEGEDVPYYLFEQEFQKTEYGYTPNAYMEVSDKLYESYKEALDKEINKMFNTSYTEILKDQDAFIDNFNSVVDLGEESQAYDFLEWYVDYNATTTAEVSTGKCMVYSDLGFNILRASVDLRVFADEGAAEAMMEKFGISADDKAKTLMAEVFFNPDGTNQIVGFTLTPVE